MTAANLVSVTGTWMQVVAQNWLVLRLTGHASAVGIVVALQALPSVVLCLAGGVLADRLSKRRVLIVTQSLLASLACFLGVAAATGTATVSLVEVLALLLGLVMAIDGPSNAALGAELVEPEALPSAVALGGLVNGVGRIVGMSLAGVLIAMFGAGTVFLINACSYLVVVAVLLSLRGHHERPFDRVDAVAQPFRAALAVPAIVLTCAIALVGAAFGRNYQVVMAAMSNNEFQTGARGYAELSVAFAIGAVAGGLVAARVRHHRVELVVGIAFGASAMQFASAFAPSITAFALCMFVIAIAAVVFDTATQCVVQLAAGDAMRGRAVALLGTVTMLGATAGAPTLGWIADHYGPRASLQLGAVVVTTCTAGIVLLSQRAGSRADGLASAHAGIRSAR